MSTPTPATEKEVPPADEPDDFSDLKKKKKKKATFDLDSLENALDSSVSKPVSLFVLFLILLLQCYGFILVGIKRGYGGHTNR